MNETDILTYLGPAAADVTSEQIAALIAANAAIEAQWPHPDEYDIREDAMSAATSTILGDN